MSGDINVQTFSGKVNITSNLLVGSSHLFVDTTNNRVGITTANPDAGLHVNSNAYVDTNFRVGSDIAMNVTSGRITAGSFEGDGSLLENVPGDSGSWVNGTNSNVHLATSTNKVGIGVLDPSHKLDVDGDINISFGSTLRVDGTPAVFSNWSVNGSDIYRSSGNVGVGTNAPVAKLNIQGTSKGAPPTSGSDGTSNGIFRLRDNFNVTLDIGTLGASPWTTWLQVADSNGMGVEYPLALQPNGGNVGIGTTDPDNTLHISGTQNQLVQIQNTSDTARLVLNGSSGTGGDLIFKQGGTTTWGIASIGDSLHFLDNDSTSQKRMTIDGDGVVINSGTLRKTGNPGCRVTMIGGQFTLPSSSHYPIVYNYEYHDTGNDYNTSTGKFTCPVAGKYLCLHMMTTRSGRTRVALSEVKLYHNTTETARQFQDTTQDSACATNVIDCAAGDTLYAGIYNANSSNEFNGAAEYGSQFIVEFLG